MMKMFAVLFMLVLGMSTADRCHMARTDVHWGDIWHFHSSSFAQCKEACRNDHRCQAVVRVDSGLCYLKNGGYWEQPEGWCPWCTSAFKPCISEEGPCSSGRYKTTKTSCSACPANTKSNGGVIWQCEDCGAGAYSPSGSSHCTSCPAGTARSSGQSSCGTCPANMYSGAGASQCTSCPPGQVSGPGASYCTQCSPGTYKGASDSSCKTCPANQFQDNYGATGCQPCGEGYVSPAGSTSSQCEVVNGAHCWELYEGYRMETTYGEMMKYTEAQPLCFKDKSCTGVTCNKMKGQADDDTCYLSKGLKNMASKKSHVYLKEAICQ